MEQGVDYGSPGIPRPGMDDQPGRLVDHQQGGILIDDFQGYVLRHDLARRRRGNHQKDFVAAPHPGGCLGRLAVEKDARRRQGPGDLGTGEKVLPAGQKDVEAQASFFFTHNKAAGGRGIIGHPKKIYSAIR